MNKLIIKLYDYFKVHHRRMAAALVAVTIVLGLLVIRINYKENITDFLPLDSNQQEAMRMYQNISGADKIIAIIGMKDGKVADADRIAEAADAFTESLSKEKLNVSAGVDFGKVTEISDFVYSNIPYFLTDADYRRMDSLLNTPGYVGSQLTSDMEMLMFPSGGMLSDNIGKDPLNLFTPVVEQLSKGAQSMNYELYDGHIFTPDMKHAVVMIESPYGSSETEQNGKLISKLTDHGNSVMAKYKDVTIHLTGGPVIAVGNASQIKSDSILTISIAVVLILGLLLVVFRSWRNIVLIAITIAWGWLFALGCLSIVHSTVSLIVVGISSIIIGIAVNYPLHLVAHLNHTPDMRQALREIVAPLLVGNITTIGAFLALVPLDSIALRDLGLFAAFLLIGTILFVFTFLPHFVKVSPPRRENAVARLGNVQLENHRWFVAIAAILTVVFAVFSFQTSFDPDFSHINFMTQEQKSDIASLSSLMKSDAKVRTLYAVATGPTADNALAANEKMAASLSAMGRNDGVREIQYATRFLVSRAEQVRRLARWQEFIGRYNGKIRSELTAAASQNGFEGGSFADFYAILSRSYSPKDAGYFKPITDGPCRQNFTYDSKNSRYAVVTPIKVDAAKAGALTSKFNDIITRTAPGGYCFEISQLNSTIANSLSDNFNYIGWACGFIVFFFLWLSFGNIELAALSFLPMAVSWLWILGLMSMLGIQFNIINIILATFIFGQGDDYTIFMTEGCQYEYAYGRKMLASYKNSIIISALIMFIGMGVLVLAKHPALRSLGEVTLVGMFSVVLMAYLLPPFIFKWIVSKDGKLRKRPLTLRSLLMPHRYPQNYNCGESVEKSMEYVRDVYYYCGTDIVKTVKRALPEYESLISEETDGTVRVAAGSYGSVALLVALLNPERTIVAVAGDDDDEAVCHNVACRITNNIKIAHE